MEHDYLEHEPVVPHDIHWLNGWFETWVRFTKTEEGLHAVTRKLRLNETDNYLIYEADAIRQGG